jgi:hypothetical protein
MGMDLPMTAIIFGGRMATRRELPLSPGGCAMVILISWKPVVFVWLLLSAMLWIGYVGSSLLQGKNPFAMAQPHPYHLHSYSAAHRANHKLNAPK